MLLGGVDGRKLLRENHLRLSEKVNNREERVATHFELFETI